MMQTSNALELCLPAVGLHQLTELKAVWHLLTERTRFDLVKVCHSAAVVVSTGDHISFALPTDLTERAANELRELCDQWQFIRPDTRSQVLQRALRSIGR
jgi:hypothetical protein